jgi:hypothetical protein
MEFTGWKCESQNQMLEDAVLQAWSSCKEKIAKGDGRRSLIGD